MQLGQIGYNAYYGSTGGLTFDGRQMPQWEQLPEHVQQAWSAAATAIAQEVRSGKESEAQTEGQE